MCDMKCIHVLRFKKNNIFILIYVTQKDIERYIIYRICIYLYVYLYIYI